MKLPGRIRSFIDEMEDIDHGAKNKLKRFISDMGESLPESPSPKEVERIVKGAMKELEIGAKKVEEPKEEKPKKEKKADKEEKVEESKKLTFKDFLSESIDQMYKLQWPNEKFGVRKGQTLFVPFRWFDSGGGFDREERGQIKKMKVGDKIHFGEGEDLINIERVSDDTPTSKNAW